MAIDPELNAFLAVFHQDIPDVDQNALNACEQEFIHLAKRVDREVAELVAARDYLVRGGHFSGESAAAFDRNVSELSVMRGQILDCLNRHRILDQYTASDQQAAEGGLWLEYASPIAVAVLAGAVALLVSRVPAWRAPLWAALKSLSQRVVKLCEDRRGAFSLRTAMMLGQVGVSVGQEFLAQTWGPVDNDDATIDTPGLVGATGEALVAALLTPAGASVAAAKVGPGAIRKVAAGAIGGLVAAGIGGAAGGYGAAVAESVYDKFSFQETDLVYGENSWREIFTKIAPQAAWDGALEEMFLGGFGGGVEGGLQHMQAGNAGSPTHAPSLPRELPQAIQANPEKALTTLENSIRQENPQWITNERVVERMTEALRPWVPHSLDSQQTHFLPAAVQADPQVALRQLVHVMVERSAMAEVGAGPEPIRAASDAPPVVASAGGEEGQRRGLDSSPAQIRTDSGVAGDHALPVRKLSGYDNSYPATAASQGPEVGTRSSGLASVPSGLDNQGGEPTHSAFHKSLEGLVARDVFVGRVQDAELELARLREAQATESFAVRNLLDRWPVSKGGKPWTVAELLARCVRQPAIDPRFDGSAESIYDVLRETRFGGELIRLSGKLPRNYLFELVKTKMAIDVHRSLADKGNARQGSYNYTLFIRSLAQAVWHLRNSNEYTKRIKLADVAVYFDSGRRFLEFDPKSGNRSRNFLAVVYAGRARAAFARKGMRDRDADDHWDFFANLGRFASWQSHDDAEKWIDSLAEKGSRLLGSYRAISGEKCGIICDDPLEWESWLQTALDRFSADRYSAKDRKCFDGRMSFLEKAASGLKARFVDSMDSWRLHTRWPSLRGSDGISAVKTVRELVLDILHVSGADSHKNLRDMLDQRKNNRLAHRVKLLIEGEGDEKTLISLLKIHEASIVDHRWQERDICSAEYDICMKYLGAVLWRLDDESARQGFIARLHAADLISHVLSGLHKKERFGPVAQMTHWDFAAFAYSEFARMELRREWDLQHREVRGGKAEPFTGLGSAMASLGNHAECVKLIADVSQYGNQYLLHYRAAASEVGQISCGESDQQTLQKFWDFVAVGERAHAKKAVLGALRKLGASKIARLADDDSRKSFAGWIHLAMMLSGEAKQVEKELTLIAKSGGWIADEMGLLALWSEEFAHSHRGLKPEEIVEKMRAADDALFRRYPDVTTMRERASHAFRVEDS